MTKENIKRLYKHFCKLEKEGLGTGNEVREQLIKSNAKANKEDIEAKHPEVISQGDHKPKTNSKTKTSKGA